MNTNSKRLGIYLSVMLVLTAVATSLRTVACIMHLDYASGLFTDTSLTKASDIIIVLTIFGMLSYMLDATRVKLRASFSTGATYVPTGILGVATAFLGIRAITHAIATCKYPILSVEMLTLKSPETLIGILTGVLAILSVAHHFFNAFTVESKDTTRAYFAVATIAFLCFYSILIYIDETVAINDPTKVLRQMAFMLAAVFFLFEARISLGREMWRIYTAFGLASASLTAYTSIPAIVTYYVNAEVISGSGVKSLASLEEYLFLLALFVFITARMCLTAFLKEEKENELIKVLGEYARERENRVNESFDRHQEIFAAKQLSIFDLYGEEIATDEDTVEESTKTNEIEDETTAEPTISDDAIYEAIFGKMPDRLAEEELSEEAEPVDEREPEEIAEDILNTVDVLLGEASENEK